MPFSPYTLPKLPLLLFQQQCTPFTLTTPLTAPVSLQIHLHLPLVTHAMFLWPPPISPLLQMKSFAGQALVTLHLAPAGSLLAPNLAYIWSCFQHAVSCLFLLLFDHESGRSWPLTSTPPYIFMVWKLNTGNVLLTINWRRYLLKWKLKVCNVRWNVMASIFKPFF
jgi:hypothetical protein